MDLEGRTRMDGGRGCNNKSSMLKGLVVTDHGGRGSMSCRDRGQGLYAMIVL